MTKEELSQLSTDELRRRLKQAENDVSRHKVMQMGLKVTLNAAYGMIGNQYSRYYDIRIAEGITLSGQLSIQWIQRKLNEYLNKLLKTDGVNYVVAGDTDSVYITLAPLVEKVAKGRSTEEIVRFLDKVCHEKFEPYIEQSYQELADYVNAFEQKMVMKREVIADRAIWRAKKNYILNVWNSEGVQYEKAKLKKKGIETERSSTPEMCRDGISDALKVTMTGTEAESQAHIKSFRDRFMSAGIDDIASPSGISDINKWMVPDDAEFKSGTPWHVKAAITYNRMIRKFDLDKKYRTIRNGDKIKIVPLRNGNPTGNDRIAYPDILPPEFNLDKWVDYMSQYKKSYLNPMQSIYDVIGWSAVKRNKLDMGDWFE